MNLFESAILTSWNCVLGPQVEFLWIPNCNNFQQSNNLSLSFDEGLCEKEYKPSRKENSIPISTQDAHDCALSYFYASKFPIFSKTFNWSSIEQCSKFVGDIGKIVKTCGQLLVSISQSSDKQYNSVSRIFFSEERNLAIVAVIFHKTLSSESFKNCKTEGVWICLAVIIKSMNLSTVLDLKHVIDSQLQKAKEIIRNSQRKLVSSARAVSFIIQDVFTTTNLLSYNLGTRKACVLTPLESTSKLEFAARAIASHLHTSGYSVVVGDSRYLINQIICILGMFNSNKERLCCQVVPYEKQVAYKSSLNIQGFFKSNNQISEMINDDLISRLNSVTIIDVTKCSVHRTELEVNHNLDENRNLLQSVDECGNLIPEMLHDVLLFEQNGLKCQYISEFCSHLKIKSISLVKILKKSRASGRLPREINSYLGLMNSTDFSLVLGYAERVRPGIRHVVQRTI